MSPDDQSNCLLTDGYSLMGKVSGAAKPKRQYYDAEFKLRVVRDALRRPAGSRIKPTCRKWAGIEPVSDIYPSKFARARGRNSAPRQPRAHQLTKW